VTTPTDEQLSRALRQLADVPGPPSLADAALAEARRRRRRRSAVGAGAGLLGLAAIAAPFALRPADDGTTFTVGAAPPAPTVVATGEMPGYGPDDCTTAPSVAETVKEVAKADWPRFVEVAVGALPARDDYVLQSAYDFCHPAGSNSVNAYAVVNLGSNREQGHLTLNLYRTPPVAYQFARTCAEARTYLDQQRPIAGLPAGELLSCTEGTATTPFVYAIRQGQITVTAVQPDGRTIWMESIPTTGEPAITAEQLTAAVTDPELVALIPQE
jgi:hypothetical protein